MALIKGMLVSIEDPLLGKVPTVVVFQYNPDSMTRTFRLAASKLDTEAEGADPLSVAGRPVEELSLTLELDATDGLEHGGPVTTAFGISPRLAAIEMLMQPVGSQALSGALGGAALAVPAARVPLVLFVWGIGRVTPVTVSSLTITETAFDELLNPIHAKADLGLTVLRADDAAVTGDFAKGAAAYYQAMREEKALLQLAQAPELTQIPADVDAAVARFARIGA
jgi:hypothetical protein